MFYGVAWYPEHWPVSRWSEDLAIMRDAGMNVVRIAEFAWSRIEPSAGRYELDWLERSTDLAAEYGIKVVVGTPSAAPPAWMTRQYPDVLAVLPDGRRAAHGGRCHYNAASPRYRQFCADVAQAMAQRLGRHGNVIGWQIDNEYWRASYDDHTRRRFQDWLRDRYGSLDRLNEAWSNAYWSQDYSDWAQLGFPTGWDNPCLVTEFYRFKTQMYVEFQKAQIDALRRHIEPRQWITHNIHAHAELDWRDIVGDLDLVAYDPYIGTGHMDFTTFGWVSDFWRTAIPSRPHWIIECQPGTVNWHREVNNAMDKGEVRAMAWHFVGHGAEAVCYWQWRSALGGQEQYHGSIVAPDGKPRPLFEEAAQVGREFAKAAPVLADARTRTPIALLCSYPDRWAINNQKHHHKFEAVEHLLSYYAPLRAAGYDLDVIDANRQPLEGYRLVIAPHAHLLTDALADKLAGFVKAGGHLLLGPRSGFKDQFNALLPSRQPGPVLASLLGAHVDEYYALEKPIDLAGECGSGQATIWAELLTLDAEDARALLTYGRGNGWLDGKPAMVSRALPGGGRISYLGAWTDGALMAEAMRWAVRSANVPAPVIAPPPGVEVCRRVKAEGEVFIVINHTTEPRSVELPAAMHEVLTDRRCEGALALGPRGVAVLVSHP